MSDEETELLFYRGKILGCFHGYTPKDADEFEESMLEIHGEKGLEYLVRFVNDGLLDISTAGRLRRKLVHTLTYTGFQRLNNFTHPQSCPSC